ncbi:MAG: ABC transporter substrate-binding protein, partial [Clostridiales bacterium]|nr:ABC transporter substrate-binding protein [Clostridiales bacterium]
MLNAKIKRITSLFVLAAVILTMISIPVYAQENDQDVDDSAEITVTPADLTAPGSRNTYSEYLDEHSEKTRPMEEIVINATDYIKSDGAELEKLNSYEGEDGVLKWSNQGGEVTYSVDVKNAGIYNIKMVYHPLEGNNITTEFELLIDGELPFDSAARISMPRKWVNEYAIKPDERDNELRPPQVQELAWMDKPIIDTDGISNEPLFFYLSEGKHEITIVGTKANLALKSMTFYNSEKLPSYSANKPSEADINSTPTFYQKIEGENAIYKTDSTLYPTYDRTSYLTSPSHPTKMRYNTIGQQNWKKAGQAIAWEIIVPNDGYYKIGIKARQNEMRGFFSNRRVYVDGEVLFEELDQVRFSYSMDWYATTLNDGEDEIYVYLKADEKHVIELEAVPGVIGESMRRLDDIIYDLNYYYRRILMITGPEPDELNDYNVDVQIPNLIEEFQRISDGLMQEKANIESMTKQKGSEATALEATAIILNRAIKKPERIPMMLGSIKDNISSVSAWMRDYRDQPLEIDYIEIGSHDAKFQPTKPNFFKSMSFGFQAFIGSFFEDYNVLTDERKSALNVWVSQGRDQAQVVKELTDSYFVPNYNTDVTINLVQGSILEATLAGKGPDIALFIGGDFPINLAVRGLLVDVSRYPDYEE